MLLFWLQEYIRVKLNYEEKNWRNQGTNTIYFPVDNVLGLDDSKIHLEYISMFPKFKNSWVQYYLCLADLGYNLPHNYCYEEMNLEDIKNSVKGIKEKLEEATSKPDVKVYQMLIADCMMIKSSIQTIALRFDESHLRFLYEFEGFADF